MRIFFAVILLNLLLFAGIYHRSLAEYYELKYHTQLPPAGANLRALDALHPDEIFLAIKSILLPDFALNTELAAHENSQPSAIEATRESAQRHKELARMHKDALAERKSAAIAQIFTEVSARSNGALMACLQPLVSQTNKLIVHASAGVVLIGDSLMQGLAQRLCAHLRAMGVPCRNLAKQSSGILHHRFYDYAEVLRDELARRPKAAAIVLAGVNDLFDAYSHGKKLAFGTDEWAQFYAQKMRRISGVAAFVALPALREDKGAVRAQWFNTTIAPIASSMNARWLQLSGEEFAYYDEIGGKMTRLRAHDGIHFTPQGYERLAQALLALLDIR